MKYILAVRHGFYAGEHLTREGVESIERLSTSIVGTINGGWRVRLLHSPYIRTAETADIIASKLGCEKEMCQALQYDEYSEAAYAVSEIEKHLADDEVDALILVTHYELPAGIISHYSKRDSGPDFNYREIGKGQALVFDVDLDTITLLSP